ncbi:TPA: S24 family peptidase [Enterobacter asburiae]|jgi:SOS-response transcriptional repressor LexA|uniref:Helix-turn-helix domain-containing protein n=1 Tax=Enterobacter ludwigii TaxID=299767 RepID=A0AAX3L6I2_9ENTR|nr:MULTISPECIES: S24 family peptidase [Enterobacter]MDI4538320.1 helix-turn-helix domain-containing protein [Escherichia coli]EKZ3172829.1 helix-turn-helix domain-containing protein [Enterobacter asburiae]MBX8912943.1 helix-turn-helix domain-containing protein [Enterobacter ludwigii]MDU7201531.1 S24 family peptidase [Enterobacter asburiae]WCE11521.1 helix-turn-helix domain-containing protein [Enterobacter ludwigii]
MRMNRIEDIAGRIKRLREDKGLSQKALAELCGWASQSRIGNYESGTRSVSVDDATVIAKALGVAPAELLFGDDYKGPYKPGDKYPVISKVQAGAWCEAVEPYTLKDIDLWLESDAHIQGEAFWLLVEGESMTAPTGLSIPEGTYVLFDTGRDAVNGSLVIAKLSDSNEATFKKLVIDGAQKYLKGLNPQWPLVAINGNCRIIGVAVETKLRLV